MTKHIIKHIKKIDCILSKEINIPDIQRKLDINHVNEIYNFENEYYFSDSNDVLFNLCEYHENQQFVNTKIEVLKNLKLVIIMKIILKDYFSKIYLT